MASLDFADLRGLPLRHRHRGPDPARRRSPLMTPKKRRRLYFAGAVVLASGGAAWLVLGALKDNVMYFHSPSEAAALHVQPVTAFRIGGLVADHSVTQGRGAETRFIVTVKKVSVPVVFD